jgi:hypothetical protein
VSVVRAAALSLVVLVAAGCTGSADSSQPVANTSAPHPTTATGTPTTTTAGVSVEPAISLAGASARLQAFLDSWVKDGYDVASRRYLTTDMQPTSPGDKGIDLMKGRVVKVEQWKGSSSLFYVDFDFQFAPGDIAPWAQGANSRFVAFTRTGPDEPLRMSFATGP